MQDRHRLAGLAIALCLFVACCSTNLTTYVDLPIRRTPAALVPATCPTDPSVLGVGNSTASLGPKPGSVPRSFAAGTVLRCRVPDLAPSHSTDGTLRTTVIEEVAPVTRTLLDSLTLPDQQFTPGTDGACSLMYTPQVFLLLVDSRRRAVRPTLPHDPCGEPRTEVQKAIGGLSFTEVKTYRVVRR